MITNSVEKSIVPSSINLCFKNFSNPINFVNRIFSDFYHDCQNKWVAYKEKFYPPTELCSQVRAMRTGSNVNENVLKKAILSEEFPYLQGDLANIFATLEKDNLENIITLLFKENTGAAKLVISRLNQLLTIQKVNAVLGFSVQEEAKMAAVFVGRELQMAHDEKRQSYTKMAEVYMLSAFKWVADTITVGLGLNNIGGEVDDPSQASMRLWMVLNMWGTVSTWLISLSAMLGSLPLTAALVSGLSCLGIGSLVAYQKWFKPVPANCSPFNNYTTIEALKNSKLTSSAFLEEKVDELIEALCANARSEEAWLQPVLIGPPGTGKSTILRELTARINSGNVPPELKGLTVFGVNSGELTSDNMSKLNKNRSVDPITKFQTVMEGCSDHVIVFFDELHVLGMNKNHLVEKTKTVFSPGPGGFRYCIGATTTEEFEKYLTNEAFLRRIKLIPVDPTDKETTRQILQVKAMQEACDLDFEDTAYDAIVDLCEEKLPNMAQPAKATAILAEAFQKAREYKDIDLEKKLKEKKKARLKIESQYKCLKERNILQLKEPYRELVQLNKEIEELEKKKNEIKIKHEQLINLKKERHRLSEEIDEMAVKISQEEVSENYIKEYAFKCHYLIRALDHVIENLKKTCPGSVVTKKMIEDIIKKEVKAREARAKKSNLGKAYSEGVKSEILSQNFSPSEVKN